MSEPTVQRVRDRSRPFRVIGYLSGPVDGAEVIKAWYARASTDYFGTVYLEGFCRVVSERNARGVVVTYTDNPDSRTRVGDFVVYNVQRKVAQGLRFHFEAVRRMLRSFAILRQEEVECVVLTEGANYWFLTSLLRLLGIEMVAALHCRIWSPFERISGRHRFLQWLNSFLFYRRQSNPFMGVSIDIGRQVVKAAHPRTPDFLRFVPTYRRETFSSIAPPSKGTPFAILSAGRIEINKGVFDLVEAARILKDRGYDFRLHICGEGTAEAELRSRISGAGLGDIVIAHGKCNQAQLQQLLGECHAVVVPTRTDFEEGFAKTCAEGVLAGRPVVTSRVCPALEDIGGAAVEVEPNDVEGYAEAFIRLMSDQAFYEAKRRATKDLSEQFYDPANSYATMLRRALDAVEQRTGRVPAGSTSLPPAADQAAEDVVERITSAGPARTTQ